jgi:putative oxidoreductase
MSAGAKRSKRAMSERLAGLLMSGIYVHGGWTVFKEPGARVDKAAKLGLPEPELLTRLSGLNMAVAGSALALGIKPRLAALALAGSLVPTTLAGHRFWEEEDERARSMQLTQFLKNLGLLGGLTLFLRRPR